MNIKKRNNDIVTFDKNRIVKAIEKAMLETEEGIDRKLALRIANDIENEYEKLNKTKTVEDIQDLVEQKLMSSNRKDVAKKYIIYREFRNQNRINNTNVENNESNYKILDDSFISKYKKMPSPMNQLGSFVYYRTYSRYIKEEKRREYWWETVRRAVEYNCSLAPTSNEEAYQLFDNIFNLKQFLSGRTFWVGNTEVSKEFPISNFNCAFEIIDSFESFKDLFYLLMVGSGVGIRVLKDDVNKLPKIRNNYTLTHKEYFPLPKREREDNTSIEFFYKTTVKITIGDSKSGK